MAFGELVGLPIVLERTIVLPGVVEVLAQRVAHADFVCQRQRFGQQGLRALKPGLVIRAHPAMCRNAEKCGGAIRIEGDGALEQFLRFGKAAAVGAQFAEECQRIDVAWVDGERGLAALLGLGGAALLAHRHRHAQVGRSVVRLECQCPAVALQPRFQ